MLLTPSDGELGTSNAMKNKTADALPSVKRNSGAGAGPLSNVMSFDALAMDESDGSSYVESFESAEATQTRDDNGEDDDMARAMREYEAQEERRRVEAMEAAGISTSKGGSEAKPSKPTPDAEGSTLGQVLLARV